MILKRVSGLVSQFTGAEKAYEVQFTYKDENILKMLERESDLIAAAETSQTLSQYNQ